jgi:hypothetical protein
MREFECIAREDGRAILGMGIGAEPEDLSRVGGYQISVMSDQISAFSSEELRGSGVGAGGNRRAVGTISYLVCRWVKMEWE